MILKEYLKFCQTTAIYPNISKDFHYPLIGLTGELGELANILKKTIRDDNNIITMEKKIELIDELGDIFWYLIMLCFELKIDPDFVLEANISKLSKRIRNNTIHDRGNR